MKRADTLIPFLALFICGCATNATGPFQDIRVTSEPTGIVVKTDSNRTLITPGVFSLERNRQHTLVAEYEGFEPQKITLTNGPQGWFWANAIFGGAIGAIGDVHSGSCDELNPKEVHFVFRHTNSQQ